MKALVDFLNYVIENPECFRTQRAIDRAKAARAELDQINADAESARNDPNDSVGGLYRLADILERHGISRPEEDHLRPIAEEIIYLRQWPAVIGYCDERIAELEGQRDAYADACGEYRRLLDDKSRQIAGLMQQVESAKRFALEAKADELESAGWTKQTRGDQAGATVMFDAAAMCRLAPPGAE